MIAFLSLDLLWVFICTLNLYERGGKGQKFPASILPIWGPRLYWNQVQSCSVFIEQHSIDACIGYNGFEVLTNSFCLLWKQKNEKYQSSQVTLASHIAMHMRQPTTTEK